MAVLPDNRSFYSEGLSVDHSRLPQSSATNATRGSASMLFGSALMLFGANIRNSVRARSERGLVLCNHKCHKWSSSELLMSDK